MGRKVTRSSASSSDSRATSTKPTSPEVEDTKSRESSVATKEASPRINAQDQPAVPHDDQDYQDDSDVEILDDRKSTGPAESSLGNADVKKVLEAIVQTSQVYENSLRECYIAQPEFFGKQSKLISGGKLREFQQFGVDWMLARNFNADGCILADEMGTGKTLQSIALIARLRDLGVYGYNMVVAPKAVLENWKREFDNFAPSIPVIIYHGDKATREEILQKLDKLERAGIPPGKDEETATPSQLAAEQKKPVILTTYEFARIDQKKFRSYRKMNVLVVDEAQKIKNTESKIHQALKTIDTDFRLLLTGTPLQNTLLELYALLSFILPKTFTSAETFSQIFDLGSLTASSTSAMSKAEELQLLVDQLHKVLNPFMLRRLKADVAKDLPPKKEYILKAPMTARQRHLYLAAKDKQLRSLLITESTADDSKKRKHGEVEASPEDGLTVTQRSRANKRRAVKNGKTIVADHITDHEWLDLTLDGEEESISPEDQRAQAIEAQNKKVRSSVNKQKLSSVIMSLRQIANHPYLADQTATAALNDADYDAGIVAQSGKMQLLDRLLTRLFAEGHKVLVFSQFTTQLNIIAGWAEAVKDWGYYRIDGQNPPIPEQIQDFNEDTSKDSLKLFLLSTRAGGVGLNLVGADTVIIFDSDWNPQVDLQAMDRAHRIGQKTPVLVFRFETENSIDSVIIERATRKRRLEMSVLGKGEAFKGASDEDSRDLIERAKGRSTSTKKTGGSKAQLEAFARRLLEAEEQKIDFAGDQVYTDKQLSQILDRSPTALARKTLDSPKPKGPRGRGGAQSKSTAGASAIVTLDEVLEKRNAQGGGGAGEDDDDDVASEFDIAGEIGMKDLDHLG